MTTGDRDRKPPTGGTPPDNGRPGAAGDDPSYQGARPGFAAPGGAFGTYSGGMGANWASDVLSAQLTQNWWAVALRGVIGILFGIVAIWMPGVTLASLILLFGVYMIIDGVLAMVAGLRAARYHRRWGTLVLEGVADLAAGAIALLWPLVTIIAFVYLLAAWAIVSGVLLTSAAFRLHIARGRALMGFGGIISILWGFLLLFAPMAGAVVLTWWIGAYALFFGGVLLFLAFRLRRFHQHDRGQDSMRRAM